MARLLDKIPLINLWAWANGNDYTIDDDTTTLTPELAKSDKQTDEAYDKRFGQQKDKGNAGKGKQSSFKEENKVSKDQLNKKQQSAKEPKEKNTEKEIVD